MKDKAEEQMMEEKYFLPIRQAEMYQTIIIHRIITLNNNNSWNNNSSSSVNSNNNSSSSEVQTTVQAVEAQTIIQLEITMETEIQIAGGNNVLL